MAQALVFACNTENTESLERAAELISSKKESGEISEKEAGWLEEIVEAGRAGDWDQAEGSARQLMKDQSGR